MHTHSAKQEAIEAITRLPDNVPLDEIIYRLYVLSKVQQGREDIAAGRAVPELRDENLREVPVHAWRVL